MRDWLKYVALRFTLFYALGCGLGIFFEDKLSLTEAFFIAMISVFIYLIVIILSNRQAFREINVLIAITSYCAFVSLGFANAMCADERRSLMHYSKYESINALKLTINSNGTATNKTNKYLAEINAVFTNNWKEASGQILLYIDNADSSIVFGDVLIVKGKPHIIEAPKNPHVLDYKQYMALNNIHHQLFLRPNQYLVVDALHQQNFNAISHSIRAYADHCLKQAMGQNQSSAIISAITLGNKHSIDREISEAYAASGAMHILAVSGLHVGIIYGIILLLFGKLKSYRYGKLLLSIIVLLVLWSYAAVTGFSPSVIRAALMFSFVALADSTDRETVIYNTIAASAFLMLVINPFLLLSVGFQLSYVAVITILLFQPGIYKLLYIKNWLLDKCWQITTVSISAVLGTMALSIYYFHQLPLLFLLSNLVVIPAAFCMLIGGLLLVMLGQFPLITAFIGKGLIYGVNWLNTFLIWIKDLPFSVLDNIYISEFQAILIGSLVIALYLVVSFKKRIYFMLAFINIIVLAVLFYRDDYLQRHQYILTVYSVSKHLALDIFNGNQGIYYGDSAVYQNEEWLQYNIIPNRQANGIYSTIYYQRKMNLPIELVMTQDLNIVIVNSNIDKLEFKNRIHCDVLILANDYTGNIHYLLDKVSTDELILDSSLRGYYAKHIMSELTASNIDYHSVYQDGAFTLIL